MATAFAPLAANLTASYDYVTQEARNFGTLENVTDLIDTLATSLDALEEATLTAAEGPRLVLVGLARKAARGLLQRVSEFGAEPVAVEALAIADEFSDLVALLRVIDEATPAPGMPSV